jgi:hypothetical protein
MRINKRRLAQLFPVIVMVLWAIAAIWLFGGCSHLTVAPKPVVATQIAFDENVQNAGLIDCDTKGCLVTSGWMERYKALEKEFSHTVPADQHIKAEGSNFRVSFEVTNNFIDLQRSHRSAP